MKTRGIAILLLSLLAMAAALQAQDLLVHAKPVKVRHLAGEVVDRRGFPVEYATVELRDAKDHHVLASTFADAEGRFAFADKKHGQRFEIRAQQKGFNLAQYTAVIAMRGWSHVRIVLVPVT